jgi:pimeloyl-ACP methyl ester carboxylesterase
MPKKTKSAARKAGAPRRALTAQAPELLLRQTSAAPYRLKPSEIERALVTGEHADLLQRYFGTEGLAEMQELSRTASARSVRGGPRVFLLPGIMGSTLGSPRKLFLDDVLWIDPLDIAAGNLRSLALIPGPARHDALGVILIAYLKLKLRLRAAGYDVDFFPFDWRLSLEVLGRRLASRIAAEPAAEIHLVAHSMGGLVSRAALAQGAAKVKRLVMLGTPNYGSFVPIQALRATYPAVRKVALLDLRHSPEELASQVFNTFAGLYQMLPAPEKFGVVDVFEAANWPKDGPRPRPELLEIGRQAQDLLAPPDERYRLIAGINQDTTTDLRREGGQFVYTQSREGDGTVPLAFAQLPGVKTWFVDEAHGSLPNHRQVAAAVIDLLATGQTAALPEQWSTTRSGERTLDEASQRELVPVTTETRRGASMSDREVRFLIEEFASPTAHDALATATSEAAPLPAQLHRVVVGRQRQRRLDLRLAAGSLTEANARAYVLGIFSDVTPGGAARAVDVRLGGAITEFTQRRMFSANVGEVFVLPVGRQALRPDAVLCAGLGPFDHFSDQVLEIVAENLVRTLVASGVDDFATVLMGAGSGRSVSASLRFLLQGFVRGLLDADRDHNFRRVTLCELDPEQWALIKAELYRLASTDLFADVEVTFEEVTLPPAADLPAAARGLGAPSRVPVYLLVRQETARDGSPEFHSALLTAGSKATVIAGRKPIDPRALDRLLSRLGAPGFNLAALDAVGKDLSRLVFSDDLLAVLPGLQGRELVIVHDALASRIPWETLRLGDWVPAADAGLSRRYMAENLSVAKWLEQRRQSPTLSLLLVVNPTGDLHGAETEGQRIRELMGARAGVRIVERRREAATHATLLRDFGSGDFDVIHYAGHAYFDRQHPARSGILCAGEQVLSGADLAGVGRLPSLLFFNACEAGRIRGRPAAHSPARSVPEQSASTTRGRLEQSVSLAEAFLRGGAANYLGTYWPVGDAAAERFADSFYRHIMGGQPLGQAVLAARQAVRDLKSVDWADYILYGNPEFALKLKTPSTSSPGS